MAKLIKEKLEKSKGIVFADTVVRMVSALNDDSLEQLELMAGELCRNYELV